ncbi:GNAT family N-acetyltransferase [Lysinibacillus fusiformis]|uniref:GNAT family N-acetyltransferase n=1 Tax=Lysinibacillus fusiformis TaxID=28031 RepID=UPI0019A5B61C|nr:GNAT family N-acetyltransferase [Lysinibacillus fusiformis]MBD8521561.1 GNAT family N-acetyltransferase [Lysinibacillus fusiformis]
MEETAIFKSVESVMPKSYFKDLLEDQNSRIFIAKNDELVKYAYIHDFGVRKTLQKQGEPTSIELNVWEFNANAIAFYKHIGMKGISEK